MSDRKRLTMEELEVLQEYQRLTDKQRLFVRTYCEVGIKTGSYDPIEAVMVAYPCKSREIARVMSYDMMSNIRIVEVLNRHFNEEPIEEFMLVLNRAIYNRRLSMPQLLALKLKAEILGFGFRMPSTTPGAVPNDVAEATKAERKAKRKKPERAPVPEKKSEYGFSN